MEKKCEQTGLEPLRLGLRVWIQKQIEILDPMMQATRGLMTLIKQDLGGLQEMVKHKGQTFLLESMNRYTKTLDPELWSS